MFVNKQNKNNLKTTVMTVNKMFDLEKLIEKEPKLFEELCSKFSLKTKQSIYIIQYLSEVADDNPSNDIINDTTLDGTCQEVNVKELHKEDYPVDFQPLYKVDEKLQMATSHGKVINNIQIQRIIPKRENDEIKGYYYEYVIEETDEVVTMDEDWLVEHEIVKE